MQDRKTYTLKDLYERFDGVSSTAVQELRKRTKSKKIYKEQLEQIKKWIYEIREEYIHVTNSTIALYFKSKEQKKVEKEEKYYRTLYNEMLLDFEITEKENQQLREENDKLKRRIKRLEQTVANYKEKDEKRYNGFSGGKR